MTRTTTIAVFVIAHPDDESMFFLPTICSLQCVRSNSRELPLQQVWLVCLSNGNYNGLGTTREIELNRAGGYLGLDRIMIVHHDELQDSPTQRWPKHVVARVLEEMCLLLTTTDSDSDYNLRLYTFDEKGVSGHINHVDTYLGVKYFLQNRDHTEKVHVQGFQLMTNDNLLTKYFPLVHWVVFLCTLLGIGKKAPTSIQQSTRYTLYQPWINWKCMAYHASQFVWYRRLFVVFSCYTYENQWRPIACVEQQSSKGTQ